MASSPDNVESTTLARGISELDLNKALNEAKIQSETGLRYTPDEILNLRPADEMNNTENGFTEAGSPLSEGVMTPPYRVCPNPPPPTPVALNNGSNVQSGDESGKTNGVIDTTLSQLSNGDQPKKKEDEAGKTNGVLDTNGDEPKTNGDQPKTDGDQPKKKKKKKSSGVNKKAMGTGFEEFYADPPLTPDEYEEERDLYDINLSFESRIQTCIQRYRNRRKLDETRSNILTKYFILGGVEATAKSFTGGLDQETLDNSTAAEIAALQASDFVRAGSGNAKFYDGSDNWVVDFEGVAKGFFSYRIPNMFPIETQKQVEQYTMTIRNFLNYILHHRVCEDYTKDVMAARKVCDLAEKELWAIKQIRSKLPGDFNVATSTLYGGRYENMHMGQAAWAVGSPGYKEFAALDQGLEVSEAERIFKTAIAFVGSDDMFLKVMAEDVQIIKTTTECFEVVELQRPDLKTREQFSEAKNMKGEPGYIKALGFLKLKYWEGLKVIPEDSTDDEDDDTSKKDVVESFWLEDEILQLCYIGLKMEIDVHELNIGIKFFDKCHSLYCSFFTALENEKMLGWKDPVPNTRPPPTEEDPELEENIMSEEADKEL